MQLYKNNTILVYPLYPRFLDNVLYISVFLFVVEKDKKVKRNGRLDGVCSFNVLQVVVVSYLVASTNLETIFIIFVVMYFMHIVADSYPVFREDV